MDTESWTKKRLREAARTLTFGERKTGRCTLAPARSLLQPSYQAGAGALPGLTSAPGPGLPLLPDEVSGGETLFGERGGRPSMMSLI